MDPLKPTLILDTGVSAFSRGQESLDVSQGRVGFVVGDRPHFTDETAALLRNRLTAAALVIVIVLAVAFLGNLLEGVASLWWLRGMILMITLGCLLLLRSRGVVSLSQLRVIELVVRPASSASIG